MQHISNIVIIFSATLLLQWHSVQFWYEQIGMPGIGWSLISETVVIWFWWHKKPVLALFTSLLLLIGPMHEISKPALINIEMQLTIKTQNNNDRIEINQHQAAINSYNKNSENRSGWLPKINETQRKIDNANLRIRNRNKNKNRFDIYKSTAIITMQLLLLLVITTAQAIAIIKQRPQEKTLQRPLIKACNQRTKQPKRSEKPKKITTTEKPLIVQKNAINEITNALTEQLQRNNLTQSQWCDINNISPKHLSLAKNHYRLVSQNKETAPKKVMIIICQKLNLN